MQPSMQNYVTSFQNLYDGEPWYGRSIVSIVREIAPTQAFKKNSPTSHSIYEIVAHMLAWRELFVKRLKPKRNSFVKPGLKV